jgi:hypothetical protein
MLLDLLKIAASNLNSIGWCIMIFASTRVVLEDADQSWSCKDKLAASSATQVLSVLKQFAAAKYMS